MKRKIKYLFFPLTVIIVGLFVIVGCSDDETDPVNPPTLTTLAVTEITETSAKSGGNISDDGESEITARGVVWSMSQGPTMNDNEGITNDGTGAGEFTSHLTDLQQATTYYVRAYATNSAGTSYGNEVMLETIQSAYLLTLEVDPGEAGSVTGAGEYQEGEHVNISATAEEGWAFVNWAGDTDYVDDPAAANTIVTMPSQNISLTANFQEADDPEPGTVTDIDGNEYDTVIIGDQEWMAENLRVTKYKNGDAIPTGLSNADWSNTTEGAYAIFDHNHSGADGLNLPEEMVAAYGKLYNWHAVDDPRGLCPVGWSVPSDDDWTQLVDYFIGQGFPNDWTNPNGAGNALKSCRQVDSPLDGCNTSEHPRWDSHGTHYGFDEFGFSALPGGYRSSGGNFSLIGVGGYWWSAIESSGTNAWSRSAYRGNGDVGRSYSSKRGGLSIRCLRDID